jgi:hypothetical protein
MKHDYQFFIKVLIGKNYHAQKPRPQMPDKLYHIMYIQSQRTSKAILVSLL